MGDEPLAAVSPRHRRDDRLLDSRKRSERVLDCLRIDHLAMDLHPQVCAAEMLERPVRQEPAAVTRPDRPPTPFPVDEPLLGFSGFPPVAERYARSAHEDLALLPDGYGLQRLVDDLNGVPGIEAIERDRPDIELVTRLDHRGRDAPGLARPEVIRNRGLG